LRLANVGGALGDHPVFDLGFDGEPDDRAAVLVNDPGRWFNAVTGFDRQGRSAAALGLSSQDLIPALIGGLGTGVSLSAPTIILATRYS
jgi:hypothetical protein